MRRKYSLLMILVLVVLFSWSTGVSYAAVKDEPSKNWSIPFMGVMPIPAQLEVVDGKDVVLAMLRMGETFEQQLPAEAKTRRTPPLTAEDVEKAFEKYPVAFYQLALKNNGTYNTAFLFTAKIPQDMNLATTDLFDKIHKAEPQKQAEFQKLITDGLEMMYVKAPELRDVLSLEILEFYPFETMRNSEAEIVSVGGSVAARTFKLINPFAIKVYLIRNQTDYYVTALIASGPERKLWNDMTKEMLSKIRFSVAL